MSEQIVLLSACQRADNSGQKAVRSGQVRSGQVGQVRSDQESVSSVSGQDQDVSGPHRSKLVHEGVLRRGGGVGGGLGGGVRVLGDAVSGGLEAVLVGHPVDRVRLGHAVLVLGRVRVGALHHDANLISDLLRLTGHVLLDRIGGLEAVLERAIFILAHLHAQNAGILEGFVLRLLLVDLGILDEVLGPGDRRSH